MQKQKGYSPHLERALVSALYHEAKARRVPMTKLANQLIRSALRYEGVWRAEDVVPFTIPGGAAARHRR